MSFPPFVSSCSCDFRGFYDKLQQALNDGVMEVNVFHLCDFFDFFFFI